MDEVNARNAQRRDEEAGRPLRADICRTLPGCAGELPVPGAVITRRCHPPTALAVPLAPCVVLGGTVSAIANAAAAGGNCDSVPALSSPARDRAATIDTVPTKCVTFATLPRTSTPRTPAPLREL